MDKWKRLGVGVCAVLLMVGGAAKAQSLGDILKQVVVDTAKETLSGPPGQTSASRALKTKPDYMRDSWNNAGYAPLTKNGYQLYRIGHGDISKFGLGVATRQTCDPEYLAHALTKIAYPDGKLDLCVAIEAQLQSRGREYDGAARGDFPGPAQVPAFREKAFSASRPLKLYFRPSVHSFVHLYRRPKGLLVDIAGMGGSNYLAGSLNGVQFALKGPQVVNTWMDYSVRSRPLPNQSAYGHIRFFLPATEKEMNQILGEGAMTDQRLAGLDNLYYTISKVRDAGRDPSGDRLFEVSLTIDRLELGMDRSFRAPGSLRPDDWDSKTKLVWTNGMPVRE